MPKYKEPIFTKEELDEKISGVEFGYQAGSLIPGYDFGPKYAGKFMKVFIKGEELLDGTAKKREIHAKINSFGFAYVHESTLVFGVKFNSPGGLGKIGKSTVEKYKQLLGYYLEQVGWRNIKFDQLSGGYEIPMDNAENIKLLYALSPSIGFYYKSSRPDAANFERWKNEAAYKATQRKMTQPEKTMQ